LEVFLTLFDEPKKSYYEALGITDSAGNAEIKRAYFKMVRKYQPDRFPEEFKEIRAAYETLLDPEKRAEYNAIGSLPASVAPIFRDAQWYERAGRHSKAAECYQLILKSHPELDNVREKYARSLSADDKTGKAAEVWGELCRRHPDNPGYAMELGHSYFERGWTRKAFDEAKRAISLDRSSIDGWLFLITCTIEQERNGRNNIFDRLNALSLEALKALGTVKKDEWKKIPLHAHALITSGIKKIDKARVHLQEITRLIREGGRDGRDEGSKAFGEILSFIPSDGLGRLYPEIRKMADLLPYIGDKKTLKKLDRTRRSFEIDGLVEKGFPEIFRDLFRLLNYEFDEDEDELEIIAIEHTIIDNRKLYYPQLRRLKEEFPELYALHSAFFTEALRTRDPEKMLYKREKKYSKLKREFGIPDDDPEYAPEQPVRRAEPKVGRNDPCPCGSGKKYKRCCGA
jgi:curved DNA-binding protein CbpA